MDPDLLGKWVDMAYMAYMVVYMVDMVYDSF